ncbi:MAG: tRNA (adenosine(37)-N6)-threonylcarbamoyltransferase complex ATPase subunit type 1 TsaE [Gemmataceae bacterium]|nr:tRNA (adenosine(37)-N6)-threonylcarbamoyltransferase complex ATPase subunit type 1 TsaE [Gemmataceae bacterium]
MPASLRLVTLEDTSRFGRRLAELLFPGAVVGLVGPLGAGKTTLVRSVAVGLGADERVVSSPTFALIHEYPARIPVYHFDTYRLADAESILALGAEEYFSGNGVCFVEWADRFESTLPAEYLRIEIKPSGEFREVTITGRGPAYEAVACQLSN